MEEILESKETEDGAVEYMVKWVGYPVADATFEPYENLVPGAQRLLKAFHQRHAEAPKDKRIKDQRKHRG